MISCKKMKPSKLCRRTYFLRTGTAPTVSEMARELGPELANIVIDTLEPSQRSAVQPDRLELSDEHSTQSRHDTEAVRGQIHEHILQIGGNVSHRVDGYWRKRLKQTAAAGISSDEVDFIKFDCRQKIGIARDEERKRYDALLEEMEARLEKRFWEEKGNLHRSYAEARQLWGKFVCQKVRKQAKDMLCKIASYYRAKLEREVSGRMKQEKDRIIKEMEQIVKTAVDQQKRMDERAIQWLVNQYEELLKFISEYNECLDTVEMTREICRLHFGRHECHSTQVSKHSLIDGNQLEPEGSVPNCSPADELEGGVHIALASLSKCNVFVVNQCLPEPVPEPAICDEDASTTTREELFGSEDYKSTNEDESIVSSIEKITIGGLTYAQPKYYKKIYNEIFPEFAISWEKMSTSGTGNELDNVDCSIQEQCSSISSDTTRVIHSETIQSEPSYRESYDPIAEIHDILGSIDQFPPSEILPAEEQFGELFDLTKSDEEISLTAESFATRYIRATSDDFDTMFPRNGDKES
ncbi:uncharacterized protein LOC133393556 [Anopheles gambiae]|uniref:uncharacterized protein LOC133393556 n=1 Tax=Anopheles gambiae TaxID=7165 RepID=UPI002AC8FCD5|nr:uncharacterized protein LOC133393556 [Anopheles gambiae]